MSTSGNVNDVSDYKLITKTDDGCVAGTVELSEIHQMQSSQQSTSSQKIQSSHDDREGTKCQQLRV